MALDETHDPKRKSWVETANAAGAEFPLQNLPLGVFRRKGEAARGGIAIGDRILDLAAAQRARLFSGDAAEAAEAGSGATLNRLMALGNGASRALRRAASELLGSEAGSRRAAVEPHRLRDTLAFMFETRLALHPTRFALETPALQRDYDACWSGFPKRFRA